MEVCIVAAVWAVTAWRLPSAWQEPWRRALWATFAALALALTFTLPAVAAAVDRAAHVAGLAGLLSHLSGVIACTAGLDWSLALVPAASGWDRSRHVSRRFLPALTMATLAVLFALTPDRETAGFSGVTAGGPPVAAFLLVFEAFLGATMTMATVLFARAAAQARRLGLLGLGLWLLAGGTATGVLYAAARGTAVLAVVLSGTVPGGAARVADMTQVLQDTAVLLILAGTSVPALGVAARAVADYRALNALRPLWSLLTTAVPQVVLGAPPSRRDDLRAGGRCLRGRLARRVTEIRDAALILRAHVSDTDAEAARRVLAAAGLGGDELDAAAEAAWLRAAAFARLAGQPPASPPAARPLTGGSDITAEARSLRLVTATWSCPAVVRAAATITSATLAASEPGNDPPPPASRAAVRAV